MVSALWEKLNRHRANILHVVWAPAVAMVAMAVGSRVLTEITNVGTFGEAKLAQGGVALAIGLVSRPATQFVMREFHDARQAGRADAFEQFARGRQLRLAWVLAAATVVGLLTASQLGLALPMAACLAAGAMLLVEVSISTELALALTRNEQRLVSIAEVVRQGGLPFVAAAAIFYLVDSSAIFIAAQAAFTLCCLWAVRRALKGGSGEALASSDETARWSTAGRRFVIPMLGTGLFHWALNVGDRYVLAHYCSDAEVGRYSAVYGLIALPIGAAGGMLARFLFPLVFGAAARNDEAAQRYMLRGMVLLTAIIGVGAVTGAIVVGPWILRVALAAEYREGSEPLLGWLAAGQACFIVASSMEMRAFAKKATLALSVASGTAALVNLSLNLWWVPVRGAKGAAMATFFGYLVYLVVSGIALAVSRRAKTVTADPEERSG